MGKSILVLTAALYYALKSSYQIWRVERFQTDDCIYITQKGVRINVYPGKKKESPYDFRVKFQEPGKRERTPAHVHIIVDMYVKHAYNPDLTLKLKEHILQMMQQIGPVNSFPPRLQFFRPQHVDPFQELDRVGEFTVEFLLVVIELLAIQEKTNYPHGSLTESLYRDFGVKDRFSVIQKAIFRGQKEFPNS
ncbi:hypothetical protein ACP6EK_03490 [Candidatus Caldatribacterium sp. SIUC1]|uniref:hypothetical protein n=1 Tax=Candidatus Caldatribacterium sp. SIUC1 TaxID=3418365 RepID=UPI003F68CDFA